MPSVKALLLPITSYSAISHCLESLKVHNDIDAEKVAARDLRATPQALFPTGLSPSGLPRPSHVAGPHVSPCGHQYMPQQGRSRAHLQLPTALSCPTEALAEPGPPLSPCPRLTGPSASGCPDPGWGVGKGPGSLTGCSPHSTLSAA